MRCYQQSLSEEPKHKVHYYRLNNISGGSPSNEYEHECRKPYRRIGNSYSQLESVVKVKFRMLRPRVGRQAA